MKGYHFIDLDEELLVDILKKYLKNSNYIVNVVTYQNRIIMEVINLTKSSIRNILVTSKIVPLSKSGGLSQDKSSISPVDFVCELGSGIVCIVQNDGHAFLFEVREEILQEHQEIWQKKIEQLRKVELGENQKQDAIASGLEGINMDGPDSDSEGTGSGIGSGGADGTGQGGKGGSGKGGSGGTPLKVIKNSKNDLLSSKIKILSPKIASEKILREAERVAQEAFKQAKITLPKKPDPIKHRTKLGDDGYTKLYNAVTAEISQLRVILEGVVAREKERVWVKNQTHGELDDDRLVDGATGEKNVYKLRGTYDPLFGGMQKKPKRLRFVMDVSSSMSRFNGADRRLDRMAATTVMIMESFYGFEHKYDYSIVGHDGESPVIPFVEWGKPPKTKNDRLAVIEMMYWNAFACNSGDHTLSAASHAITNVMEEEADDYFMFLLSDANLGAYGINDKSLASVLLRDKGVNTYAVSFRKYLLSVDKALFLTSIPTSDFHVIRKCNF